MTAKSAGASCPACDEPFCAEFALKGEPPRWSCSCGASGPLFGKFTARKAPAAAAPAAGPKKHWRER